MVGVEIAWYASFSSGPPVALQVGNERMDAKETRRASSIGRSSWKYFGSIADVAPRTVGVRSACGDGAETNSKV
jgi:hypothetical protein